MRVTCSIEQYDGDGEYGEHVFEVMPRVGDTIELWIDSEAELIAVVRQVRIYEVDVNDDAGGDVILFVEPLVE